MLQASKAGWAALGLAAATGLVGCGRSLVGPTPSEDGGRGTVPAEGAAEGSQASPGARAGDGATSASQGGADGAVGSLAGGGGGVSSSVDGTQNGRGGGRSAGAIAGRSAGGSAGFTASAGRGQGGGPVQGEGGGAGESEGEAGVGGGPFASCAGFVGNECQGGDCCASPLVEGGTFGQGEPDEFEATVSSFRLDAFEVTVGRFRQFVSGYDDWRERHPRAGAGAHPRISDSGWHAEWTALLPATASDLTSKAGVKCDSYATWRDGSGNEDMPIDCVDWFTAFAFCIWDGGRLPTESEWEYAAANGEKDTLYPWGDTPVPDDMDDSRAVYRWLGNGSTDHSTADMLPVGSRPLGTGSFGHQDLAGSMWEWALDWYDPYPTSAVSDYSKVDSGAYRVMRGGDFRNSASYLAAAMRHGVEATHRAYMGIRCARAP